MKTLKSIELYPLGEWILSLAKSYLNKAVRKNNHYHHCCCFSYCYFIIASINAFHCSILRDLMASQFFLLVTNEDREALEVAIGSRRENTKLKFLFHTDQTSHSYFSLYYFPPSAFCHPPIGISTCLQSTFTFLLLYKFLECLHLKLKLIHSSKNV